jgi:hypothetical protein
LQGLYKKAIYVLLNGFYHQSLRLRQNNRPYGYRGLKIFTSLKLRFQDFQRVLNTTASFGVKLQGLYKKAIYVLLNGFYHQRDRIAEQFFQFI